MRKYGHVLHDLTGQRSHLNTFQGTYSKGREAESLDNLTGSFARQMGAVKRFNTALFTGSIFQKHLESLEDSVKTLQELSEKLFIEHVCNYGETDWKDQKSQTAARSHLTYLADRSSVTSQALRALVENTEDHNVDFCLDYDTSPDERQQKLFQFARECHLPYSFCVSPRHSLTQVSKLKLHCREVNIAHSSRTTWHQSLLDALQKLCDGDRLSSNPAYVRTAENALGFVLSQSQLPEHDRENLRTFMLSKKANFARDLHGEFSRSERTRLSYELAECALLFLRTEWFSELCSCCVYRLENSDLKTAYTVRINRLEHDDHIDSETGQSCDQKQWCEE